MNHLVNPIFDPSEHEIFRRHPLSLLAPLVISILMLLPLALIILSLTTTGVIDSPGVIPSLWLFGTLYGAFALSYFMTRWIFWYLDAWHLTPDTLIDIELTGLFNRSIAQTNLDQVQDVKVNMRGYLANIFNFGDVTVQTAGSQSFFELRAIPHPHEVARKIAMYSETQRNLLATQTRPQPDYTGNPVGDDELGTQ